jgi:hypothetical protein
MAVGEEEEGEGKHNIRVHAIAAVPDERRGVQPREIVLDAVKSRLIPIVAGRA